MKILITGGNGQLASGFARHLKKKGVEVNAFGREQLNISDRAGIEAAFLKYRPDTVINCAAYNLVDKAESEFDAAYGINALGVQNLAEACKKTNALLVHYSTDYVFDGTKEGFYSEDDTPNPLGNYGKSKLAGEKLLAEKNPEFLLFRVSWVFGQGRQNFFYKLGEWAKEKKVLKVSYNEISVPVYVDDIVVLTLSAMERGLRGTYHLTNSGYASRYEAARYYIEKMNLSNIVLPVDSAIFRPVAKRPYFSAMSNAKLSKALNREIPDWRDAVDRFVNVA